MKKILAGVSVAALVAGASLGMTSCGNKAGDSAKTKVESGKSSCGKGSCGGKKDDKGDKSGKSSCGKGSCGGKKTETDKKKAEGC